MEVKHNRRVFDKEFKKEAVRLVIEGGRKVPEVARSLGVHESLLRYWKRKFMEDPEGSFPGKSHLKPQEEAIRRLERELASVKEDREILKKALAIFSPRRG